MSNQTETFVSKYKFGLTQRHNNVVSTQVGYFADSNTFVGWFTVVMCRFPFGDLGYMFAVDGPVRFARQIGGVEEENDIYEQMRSDNYSEEYIEAVMVATQQLIDMYWVYDKKTKCKRMM